MFQKKRRHKRVGCPLQGMIAQLTKKWSLLVLNEIGLHGEAGYNGILRALDGISPKSLADTLKELQAMGLVQRRVVDTTPLRVNYTLTKNGRTLRQAIIPLLEWAAETTNHRDCPILGR
ncbi:MAG: helix-turn-helix domain-containing protein [Thermoprotei archaeon]